MKIDFDKYKNIEIDKDKFKDLPTNEEQLRNCLAICYVLMEDKDKEIERLNEEVEKYKKRCYEALKLIRENYGLLDKYGIDMLDDILNGK